MSLQGDDVGSWISSLWKTNTHLFCMNDGMAADDLATHGVRASAAMLLTQLFQNIPVSAPEELTHLPLVPHICVSESGQHRFR